MRPRGKTGVPIRVILRFRERYARDTNILKTMSEGKVTVTRKWYVTLPHPKMHPHTKFGIHTLKNIADMHRTRSETGTDGQCDHYLPPTVPLGA